MCVCLYERLLHMSERNLCFWLITNCANLYVFLPGWNAYHFFWHIVTQEHELDTVTDDTKFTTWKAANHTLPQYITDCPDYPVSSALLRN
jgi:hypothetical protein